LLYTQDSCGGYWKLSSISGIMKQTKGRTEKRNQRDHVFQETILFLPDARRQYHTQESNKLRRHKVAAQ